MDKVCELTFHVALNLRNNSIGLPTDLRANFITWDRLEMANIHIINPAVDYLELQSKKLVASAPPSRHPPMEICERIRDRYKAQACNVGNQDVVNQIIEQLDGRGIKAEYIREGRKRFFLVYPTVRS